MMKAIIIAAGKGDRLGELTDHIPKCLLDIKGKSILQYQLDAYRENKVTDINLVKGYLQEKINVPQIKYFINDNYENNNILSSLMYAEEVMDSDFIASYSDIIFEGSIVKQLMQDRSDISIVIDKNWQDNYIGRHEHPVEEAEKVVIDPNGYVRQIGKSIECKVSDGTYEFIGMLKCTKQGSRIFRDFFHQAKMEFSQRPFIRAKTFDQAYLTDFIQYLTDNGIRVHSTIIRGGWKEIDIKNDLEQARN